MSHISSPARQRRLTPRALFLLGGLLVPWAVAADDAPAPPPGTVVLKGHAEAAYAVAFTPDGRHVVTASFDKTLKVWDAATGKEGRTYGGPQGHQGLVLAVAVSPDGQTFASGGADNSARLWDFPSDTPARQFAHNDSVNAVALTPDGKTLAGAGKDGGVRVWGAADGKQLADLKGHAGAANGVAFVGNGPILASVGADGTLRFRDVAKGQPVATYGAHNASVSAVAVNPNNAAAYTVGEDGLLKFWKLPPDVPRPLPPHADAVTALMLSNDGNGVLTGGADKTVRLSNFGNGQPLRQWKGPTAAVTAVALSSNGAVVAGGTADGRLFLWNGANDTLLSQALAHSGPTGAVAFHPNGSQLLSGGGDGLLKTWALPPLPVKTLTQREAHAGGVTCVAYHGNGTQAVSGGADKAVKLWDLAQGKVVRAFGPLADPVSAVAFSRDFALVGAAAGKMVKVWNVVDGKESLTLTHPAAVSSLAFSPDKTRLVTGAADNTARVWDVASGKELQSFAHAGPVSGVAFHPNGLSVVVAGGDRAMVHAVSATRVVVASEKPLRALALTASGSHAVTAGDDGKICLWNLGNGVKERTFEGAAGALQAVAVSRNGALVAAGGAEGVVRFYTFADAKMIGQFKAPGPVRGLAFSPNGQALAAACADRSLLAWNVVFNPGQPPPPAFGTVLQTYAHDGAAHDVLFAPDSVTLYSAGADKAAKAWKIASEVPVRNFGHPREVDAVAFDPAGTRLATGCHDGNVRLFDVAKGQQLKEIKAHLPPAPPNQNQTNPVYAVAWNPAGTQVVSAGMDHALKLWDAATGTLVREIKAYKEKEADKGHRDPVFCVAFSPDGKLIASGSAGQERGIKLWNVADGSLVRDFVNPSLKAPPGGTAPAHPGWVYGVRFTPDGKSLVSVGAAPKGRGYLAVWNVADGKLLYGAEMALGTFYSVAVSPDGKRLAVSAGATGGLPQDANAGYIFKTPDAAK